MLLGHENIRWNPVTKDWFCGSCGRTSDKGSEWDARVELQQYECEPPTEIRSKIARVRKEARTESEEINPSEGGTTERRRYPRLHTSVQLELLAQGAVAPIRTKTDEISLGGCYVETMFTLPIATRLTIVLWLGEHKVSTSGHVVSRFPQVGNGIEFADMSTEDEVQLSRFIAERLIQQPAR